MTKKCEITGKLPMSGNSVSHAHNKKRKRFLPNLHWHRFWHPTQKRFVRLRLSTKAIRIIDKYGIEAVLDSMGNNKKLRKSEAMTTTSSSNDSPTEVRKQADIQAQVTEA